MRTGAVVNAGRNGEMLRAKGRTGKLLEAGETPSQPKSVLHLAKPYTMSCPDSPDRAVSGHTHSPKG